jgi:hypothetical protein
MLCLYDLYDRETHIIYHYGARTAFHTGAPEIVVCAIRVVDSFIA